jgi:hypothetical protein
VGVTMSTSLYYDALAMWMRASETWEPKTEEGKMHIEPKVEIVEGPLGQRKVDQARNGMRMRKALMTGTAVRYRIREVADLGLESVQRTAGDSESALRMADAAAAAEMVGRVGRERTAMQVTLVLSSIAGFAGHTVVVAVAVEEVGEAPHTVAAAAVAAAAAAAAAVDTIVVGSSLSEVYLHIALDTLELEDQRSTQSAAIAAVGAVQKAPGMQEMSPGPVVPAGYTR